MIPDRDDQALLDRLRRRMSGIEEHVPDPPALDWQRLGRRSEGSLRTWAAAAGAVAVLAVIVGAFMLGVLSSDRRPPVSAGQPVPPPPAEDLVGIDSATLSDDRRQVRLGFTGGAPYSPLDPCTAAYSAWGRIVDGQLEVAVYEVERWQFPLGSSLCFLIGYERDVVLELAEPFAGNIARDIRTGGFTFLLDRPDGLYELDVPDGWRLVWDEDFPWSPPTRQWRRMYLPQGVPGDDVGSSGLPGRLDFYQAFGSPVQVYTEGTRSPVTVNGSPATVDRRADTGALALFWRIGADGLALVASEADFSVDELIALAETAHLP